jgi:hypothetical protein
MCERWSRFPDRIRGSRYQKRIEFCAYRIGSRSAPPQKNWTAPPSVSDLGKMLVPGRLHEPLKRALIQHNAPSVKVSCVVSTQMASAEVYWRSRQRNCESFLVSESLSQVAFAETLTTPALGLPSDFLRKIPLSLRSGEARQRASARCPHIHWSGGDLPSPAGDSCGSIANAFSGAACSGAACAASIRPSSIRARPSPDSSRTILK